MSIPVLDKLRRDISPKLNKAKRVALGQYFTPTTVANFMAAMFTRIDQPRVRILDPGAGIGLLTAALVERIRSQMDSRNEICSVAYEIDVDLVEQLKEVLACKSILTKFDYEIRNCDFIQDVTEALRFRRNDVFSHAILNPPYKKIASASLSRRQLRSVGIETVNLYTAFVALSILVLERNGELVAIVPRSFCNGPYYRHFRTTVLRETAIRSIHLFNSRDKAFRDDDVLQENVILHLERGAPQENVKISTSSDDSFSDLIQRFVPFDEIVHPSDDDYFFHIPISAEPSFFTSDKRFNHCLHDLNLQVSTGPVVDFRSRDYLLKVPDTGTAPLLYPGHFIDGIVEWPKTDWKKANAIEVNDVTRRSLYPIGFYTVVRRFSSKEEKRRINAAVVNPKSFGQNESLGFENKLNVFHHRRHGLDENIAFGLATFLNSSRVDVYFRRFNGHTQVNATDLRALKYPEIGILQCLGMLAKNYDYTDMETADRLISSVV